MLAYRILDVTSVTNVHSTSVIAQAKTNFFHSLFSKITYRILYNAHFLKLNSDLLSNKTPAARDSLVSKGGYQKPNSKFGGPFN